MKYLILGVILLLAGCSSRDEKVKQEVSSEAQAVTISQNPQAQYEKAIAEIEASHNFNDDQKKRLIQLIDNYVEDLKVLRLKRSQYRSVLLKEMLVSSEAPSKKAVIAKETLKDINQEAANQLDKFVADFKFITGEDARNQRGLILQVIDTW